MLFRFPNVSVNPLYNLTIVVEDATVSSRLNSALTNDIVPALSDITGETFTVVSSSSKLGVIRVQVDGALATQQYTITGTTSTDLIIKGGGWRGCMHGLYAWLRELGCYHLMPGTRWRITPTLTDLRRTLSINRTPAIESFSWTNQGNPGGYGQYPYGTDRTDAWYSFLAWNGQTQAHFVSPSVPRQLFGGHNDYSVYSAKTAELDADSTHFAQYYPDWAQSTAYYTSDYDETDLVCANSNRYQCSTSGTSAGAGTGPSGTGTGIADGTAAWDYVGAGTRRTGTAAFNATHEGHSTGTDYSGTSGVVGIYADYTVNYITTAQAALPGSPAVDDCLQTSSVAVGDGYPYCRCLRCTNLLRNEYSISADARPSDLSLWRAGKIYNIVKASFPSLEFRVNDYAYDFQSMPPTPGWTINSNIHVILAQYKYQKDGLPLRVRFEQWSTRRDLDGFTLGIYDYWALNQHVTCDARFSTTAAWRRFRDEWLAAGITSFQGESTISAGATGLQFWGALRLLWDSSKTDSQLMTEWCSLAFGAAASHVQSMLERWWSNEWPLWKNDNPYEMALSFEDLRLADAAVTADASSRARVAAMQAYLIWLHYRQVWRNNDYGEQGTTPPALGGGADAAYGEILEFLWRANSYWMVDTLFMHDVLLASPYVSASFVSDWTIPTGAPNIAAWEAANGIVPYADSDIRALFETIRTGSYGTVPTPATHTAANETSFTRPYTPASSTFVDDNWITFGESADTGAEFIFEVRAGTTDTLRVSSTNAYKVSAVRIRIENATTGALVSQTDYDVAQLTYDGSSTPIHEADYDLSLMTPGFYRLFVETGGYHRISYNRSTPIVRVGHSERVTWLGNDLPYGWFPHYFFVPKGVTSFHVYDLYASRDFIDDNGTTATKTNIAPNVYRITVPSGQDQKVWRFEGNNGIPPRLLDIPNWTSPTRAQIIVPTNLWTE